MYLPSSHCSNRMWFWIPSRSTLDRSSPNMTREANAVYVMAMWPQSSSIIVSLDFMSSFNGIEDKLEPPRKPPPYLPPNPTKTFRFDYL